MSNTTTATHLDEPRATSGGAGASGHGGAPNAYLRTKVLTATPAELRLMLFDGALRFARSARAAIVNRNLEQTYEGITRCQAILLELINALRPEHDAELCSKLSGLYTFLYTRLIEASTQRDAAIVDEVISLLEYERETWLLLMDRLPHESRDIERDAAAAGGNLSVQG